MLRRWLLALGLALASPGALASLPRPAPAAARAETPSSFAPAPAFAPALAPDSACASSSETPAPFGLGDVALGEAEPERLALGGATLEPSSREERFALFAGAAGPESPRGAASLGEGLRRGLKPGARKTRIGVFEVLGSPLVGVFEGASLELHWGYEQFGLGLAEGLFPGVWTDPVVGLAYHRARFYDARTAAFLQPDPEADVDSPNLYLFAGARPHDMVDPMGTALWDPAAAYRWIQGRVEDLKDAALQSDSALVDFAGTTAADLLEGSGSVLNIGTSTGQTYEEQGGFKDVDGSLRIAAAGAGDLSATLLTAAGSAGSVVKLAGRTKKGAEALKKVEDALAAMQKGRKAESCVLSWAAKAAQATACFVAGTLVLTANGLVPIEEIRPGDRVMTPETVAGTEAASSAWPEIWKRVRVEMPIATATAGPGVPSRVVLDTLQPDTEVARLGLEPGRMVPLQVEAVEAAGEARVTSVEPVGFMATGAGQLVSATITRIAPELVVLTLEGDDEPLRVTPEHPLWAEGKGWTQAGELKPGDALKTVTGDLVLVASVERDPTPSPVFNLSVDEDHSYFVDGRGVLVHNACPRLNLARPRGGGIVGTSLKHADATKTLRGALDTGVRIADRWLGRSSSKWAALYRTNSTDPVGALIRGIVVHSSTRDVARALRARGSLPGLLQIEKGIPGLPLRPDFRLGREMIWDIKTQRGFWDILKYRRDADFLSPLVYK